MPIDTKQIVLIIIFSLVALDKIINTLFSIKAGTKTATVAPLELLRAKLPDYIRDAENAGFTDGSRKLAHALRLSIAYMHNLTGEKVEELYKKYEDQIIIDIENILNTPQKKED